MCKILQVKLPLLNIRSELVKEDSRGIAYKTMFQGYILANSEIQTATSEMIENLYEWKDILLPIFKCIDSNQSGSINRDEFAEIIKVLVKNSDPDYLDTDEYVTKLIDILDSDGNGRINFEEFLKGFKLIAVK